MLTRAQIETQLGLLEEALIPATVTRREAEALLRARLAEALSIRPDDVAVSWDDGRLVVTIPTRLHYHEHLDLIHARLEAVARRVIFDFTAQTPEEFVDTMQRLRKL